VVSAVIVCIKIGKTLWALPTAFSLVYECEQVLLTSWQVSVAWLRDYGAGRSWIGHSWPSVDVEIGRHWSCPQFTFDANLVLWTLRTSVDLLNAALVAYLQFTFFLDRLMLSMLFFLLHVFIILRANLKRFFGAPILSDVLHALVSNGGLCYPVVNCRA
jgi:hypothetical protein